VLKVDGELRKTRGVMAAERERIQGDQGGPAVTITLPATGETSEAQLEEDSFHMLWLVHRNRQNSGRLQILLSAALQSGWHIVHASPEEQALLDSHGLGSERVQ
jgi:hypothetical protein